MSGRAKSLFEYAARLEQIRVDMVQLSLPEVAFSLDVSIEILRRQAEIELNAYARRYGKAE